MLSGGFFSLCVRVRVRVCNEVCKLNVLKVDAESHLFVGQMIMSSGVCDKESSQYVFVCLSVCVGWRST